MRRWAVCRFLALLAMAGAVWPAAAQDRCDTSQRLPLFDTVAEGMRDPAPPPPVPDAFEQGLLAVCGAWGSKPSRAALERVLSDPAHAPSLHNIREKLADLLPGQGQNQLASTLASLWSAERGGAFTHVFCGEPSDKLGGLHFAPRLAELERQGVIARATCGKAEVQPPVYSVPLLYQRPSRGDWRLARIKSFSTSLSAVEIFAQGTRASLRLQALAQRPAGCRIAANDTGQRDYGLQIYLRRDGGLATVYPVTGPLCGTGRDERCVCH